MSIEKCYRTLGLSQSASAEEVQAAFRRLAKELHPDVSRSRAGQRRFVAVVHAYHLLQEKLRRRPLDANWGRCPRCGRYECLLDAIDGAAACADCLLGLRHYRRFLPLLLVATVKHLCVFGLYAAGVTLLVLHTQNRDMSYAGWSYLCMLVGLVVLAIEVVWFTRKG